MDIDKIFYINNVLKKIAFFSHFHQNFHKFMLSFCNFQQLVFVPRNFCEAKDQNFAKGQISLKFRIREIGYKDFVAALVQRNITKG
jgi:hypothetical protein